MKVLLALSLLGILWFAEAGVLTSSTWAVLVAGSKDWWNYRHQADICHAYHVLINSGVHPDRIIVFMYDDVANHPENKNPGQIFNSPGGPDVYKGVKIDYRGEDVNVENFKNVLLGNKEALKGIGTGRVLESGPEDVVFINFADLGTQGLLTFPNGILPADDLNNILEEMRARKTFSQMLLFIQACEAGSLFTYHLGSYDNILAITATSDDEFSWAWYCDDHNCLGNIYSISWMESLEKLDSNETIFKTFNAVRTRAVEKSHTNLYGDYKLGFLELLNYNSNKLLAKSEEDDENVRGVISWDVPFYVALKLVKHASPEDLPEKKMKLDDLIKRRDAADKLITSIFKSVAKGDDTLRWRLEYCRYPLTDKDMFQCYKSLVASFDTNCYNVSKHTYYLKHLHKFGSICATGMNEDDAKTAIKEVCSKSEAEDEPII